ncbi:DUF3418 domain-containing protein, partial [Kingella kingae]|uniref:DUF3418 domain-containing protein n=1 Tax=Kingella kingae TaxID=504 RepID=UPI001314AF22
RLEKYSANTARDAAREADIQEFEAMLAEKLESFARQNLPVSGSLNAFGWQIEELRV